MFWTHATPFAVREACEMRHVLICLAAITGLTTTGSNAIAAPPSEQATVASWTGPYVGAQFGWDFQQAHTDYNAITNPNPNLDLSFVFIHFFASGVLPTRTDQNGNGRLGGLTAGYNIQRDMVVLGVEGDTAWFDAGHTSVVTIPPTVFAAPGTVTTTAAKTDWLGTLRLRVGTLALSPRALLFVSGGLAVGHAAGATWFIPIINSTCGDNATCSSGSGASVRAGWTVGGGLEQMFMPGWTAKAEYLYYDLGSFSYSVNEVSPAAPALAGAPNANARVSAAGHIVRVGINYKLN